MLHLTEMGNLPLTAEGCTCFVRLLFVISLNKGESSNYQENRDDNLFVFFTKAFLTVSKQSVASSTPDPFSDKNICKKLKCTI